MRSRIGTFSLLILASAAWTTVQAQSRQAQVNAELAKTKNSTAVKACSLLTKAEIKAAIGRDEWALNDDPFESGSVCDFGGVVSIRVYSSAKPEDEINWTLKNYKVEKVTKHPVSGFGAGAYVFYFVPESKYQDTAAFLVGRAGTRMFMMSLSAPDGKSAESVQPQLVSLAKTVADRLNRM